MDYESLVNEGIAAREMKDAQQWKLGDLANQLPDTALLKDYADAVGVRPSSMSDYHQLSAFYPDFARAKFPNLSYSHYRRAWRVHRDDAQAALDLLEQASADGWTIRQMERELAIRAGKPQPRPITVAALLDWLGAEAVLLMTELDTKLKFEIEKILPGRVAAPAGMGMA